LHISYEWGNIHAFNRIVFFISILKTTDLLHLPNPIVPWPVWLVLCRYLLSFVNCHWIFTSGEHLNLMSVNLEKHLSQWTSDTVIGFLLSTSVFLCYLSFYQCPYSLSFICNQWYIIYTSVTWPWHTSVLWMFSKCAVRLGIEDW